MYGWCGKILKIDLERKQTEIFSPEKDLYKKFIGGRGLAGHYLKKYIRLKWKCPEMPLLFFTGPLVNTVSPTPGRMTIMSKSPLTGTICDSSCGGTLGSFIKKAGYDGIIISGKSENLTGIEINNEEIRFVDASNLKLKEISFVTRTIQAKGATAVIGPAAESGVFYSSIVIDNKFVAGRGGLGLVAASKNLKYLTVYGTGRTEIHDNQLLKEACTEILRLTNASPILMGEFGISKFGTGALYDLMDSRKMMPTNNFKATSFKNAHAMNAFNYRETYGFVSKGCRGCHIKCKKNARDGRSIPEFETMSHFSALLENKSVETVMEANRICNEAGMDTITSAATLACYSEINNEKLSPEKILELLKDISLNRGCGMELSRGSAFYASGKKQAEKSMSVKKLELSAYDPRGAYGMALSFALSTRGACHLRAYPISHEILRKPVATDRFSLEGKAGIIKTSEDMNAVADSLTACKFIFFAATIEEFSKIFEAVTGENTSGEELLEAGERIVYNERIMNAANGFSAENDDLPKRFFEEKGTGNSMPINRKKFLKAREDYYKIRKLDKNGIPLPEVIKSMGL